MYFVYKLFYCMFKYTRINDSADWWEPFFIGPPPYFLPHQFVLFENVILAL